ncbi:centromere protein I [Callorhinchus milii]|uniref:Centromere protein I n=1 Tax=Callorhinchus milii TaxID=7868 RepID=A0A4W3GPX7_CALMI|nr:centromere protein I [Callorhinchus milii]|eukprot:gi/632935214/ref/XP_007889239.1/ PREDICTED: centromere protein I [Callorhinchus milii]
MELSGSARRSVRLAASTDGAGGGAGDEVALEQAVEYFIIVKERTPSKGIAHLETIGSIAFARGLLPEVIEALLDVAMSAKFVERINTRLLNCLIPASVVPESAVVKAISWICTRKPSTNIQVLLFRWLLTVFDLLDSKKQLHSLYGVIFFYLQIDKLCPYICHLLYLLTKKEHVKRFRVKKLIELQAKKGMQPHLVALLLLYKIYAPQFVYLALPAKLKNFQVSNSHWKKAIEIVQNNGYRRLSEAPVVIDLTMPLIRKRKRKINSEMIPVISSVSHTQDLSVELMLQSGSFPLEQLRTFSQLLQNFDRIEFPAQMGSVLRSPLLLHYINWVKDDSALLRLDFWLAQTLQEEFTDCKGDDLQKEAEFRQFVNLITDAQEFLQEGFSCCEDFILKCFSQWDTSWCSTQILTLLTRIPPGSVVLDLYLDPLMKLFFTSSIYFKCSVIESLNNLLINWLTWHSVCVAKMDKEINNILQSPQNVTLAGLVNSISELVEFTARISTVALQVEAYNSLLLHFILNFYETVSDMYLKYSLPLVIMPPPGVFYPTLLCLESVSLNQLCYIMNRYRKNLIALKSSDASKKAQIGLKVNSRTFHQYNTCVKAIVGCLWTSRVFAQDSHLMGIGIVNDVLAHIGDKDYKNSFTIVNHPALVGHALNFIQKGWPNEKKRLWTIKGKVWNWYMEYLGDKGLDGVTDFLECSITRLSSTEH